LINGLTNFWVAGGLIVRWLCVLGLRILRLRILISLGLLAILLAALRLLVSTV
jgi:hypothetical protein